MAAQEANGLLYHLYAEPYLDNLRLDIELKDDRVSSNISGAVRVST